MSDPMIIKVEGMGCQSCVSAVEKAVRSVAPTAGVDVSLPEGTVRITDAVATREALEAAIAKAGYDIAS